MIPIKIQCGCGQRYAFEVEPVRGRVPGAVACPVCGTDGTDAANTVIAQRLAEQPVRIAPAPVSLHIAASPQQSGGTATLAGPAQTVPRRPAPRLPGQMDHAQAQHEARAKISWGDPPNEVIKFLRIQGFPAEEATAIVQELFHERVVAMRASGIKKIVLGSLMICLPIVSFLIFLSIGLIPIKTFAVTVMIGFWGLWCVTKGIFMTIAPKSQPGDVSEQ